MNAFEKSAQLANVRRFLEQGGGRRPDATWPDRAALIEIARNYAPSFDGLDSARLDTLRMLVLDYFGAKDREP